METKDNVQKGWRTRQQKEELILQWQQGGKSRKEFCQGHGIGYNSFVSWCKDLRDRKSSPGFSEIKINNDTAVFASVHLPGGIKIDFHQPITGDFIRSFIKS